MCKIEKSIYVEASAEEIIAVALDPDRISEWYAGVEQFECDQRFPEVGGEGKLVIRSTGVSLPVDIMSIELDRGKSFVYRMDGMVQGTVRWWLTPEKTGTRLTVTQIYDFVGRIIPSDVSYKPVIEQDLAEDLEMSLTKLASIVEVEAALHIQGA